jgi:hypothetical protein
MYQTDPTGLALKVQRAIQAIAMRHPHVPHTFQFFKKFCSRSIAELLKGTNHGANEYVAKLLHFPSPGESSHWVKQYFHLHPVSSNFDESLQQPPISSRIPQL